MTYDTFLMVMAAGLTGAGLVHSGWLWLGSSAPSFTCLLRTHGLVWVPIRVFVLMFAAPLIIAGSAVRTMDQGWQQAPVCALGLVCASMWCAMSGIVILVTLQLLMV
jgi:hypothetical protein